MSELKQLTNVIRKEMELRSLLEEAVYVWPQFDWNMDLPPGRPLVEADVNGGDLADWFAIWREKVRRALGITERMRPEDD
jgi:hypothetical protein